MTRLRYVKTLEQVKKARENDQEFPVESMRQIRADTRPTRRSTARSCRSRSSRPHGRPCASVHRHRDAPVARAHDCDRRGDLRREGLLRRRRGVSLITMPMTTEQAVVPAARRTARRRRSRRSSCTRTAIACAHRCREWGSPTCRPRGRSANRSGRASSPSTATASRCFRRASSRSTSISSRC